MLPPKYPRSPCQYLEQQNDSNVIPYPNKQREGSTSRQKNVCLNKFNSLDSKSRASKYQHLKTVQSKRKALGKRRYINQLAYLDYEQKQIQIHTKYTIASRLSALKKIKAKNQMAQFIEQQEQQEVGFEQLMDYKYGRQNDNDNYFFQKNQLINQYNFCPQCDCIHNDHPQVHEKICRQRLQQNYEQYDRTSNPYTLFALKRIQFTIRRTTGQQYDSLKQLTKNLITIQTPSNGLSRINKRNSDLQQTLKYLFQLLKVNVNDNVLSKIIEKILKELYGRSMR